MENEDIIKLPCKIGDDIFAIVSVWHLDDEENWKYHYEKDIAKGKVTHMNFSINKKNERRFTIGVTLFYDNTDTVQAHSGNDNFSVYDFGKIWFLDEGEAKKKLKEIKKNI